MLANECKKALPSSNAQAPVSTSEHQQAPTSASEHQRAPASGSEHQYHQASISISERVCAVGLASFTLSLSVSLCGTEATRELHELAKRGLRHRPLSVSLREIRKCVSACLAARKCICVRACPCPRMPARRLRRARACVQEGVPLFASLCLSPSLSLFCLLSLSVSHWPGPSHT